MNSVEKNAFEKGMTYEAYRNLIHKLLSENKTTGDNHSEAMIKYTQLNETRMKRLDKTTGILPDIEQVVKNISRPQTWLIITEAWCGDAAQIVPVIDKLAQLNEKVSTKYVLRDENEELINLYLTNGGKSIPIIIVIDNESGEVLSHWGPRPNEVQDMVIARKNSDTPEPYDDFVIKAQKWYAKDKTVSIQKEFITSWKS